MYVGSLIHFDFDLIHLHPYTTFVFSKTPINLDVFFVF